MKAKFLVLLLGLLIGLGAAVLFPRLRDGLTPGVLKSAPTEGIVDEKRSEDDRLLLTLVTPDGAVLATFTRKVPEIDLLVAPGDTVSLALDGYRPFVEDPEIERVVKATPDDADAQPLASVESAVEAPVEEPVGPPDEDPVEPAADAPVEPPAEDPAGPGTEDPLEPRPEPGG